jgi:ABC-type lipoprotein export system ATPase subunit
MLFESEDLLRKELDALMMENKHFSGLISLDIPLISNLDVWSNIALIKLYKENLPRHEAELLVLNHLKRYGLENIAYKRSADLTGEQRFCVMLLRAAMVNEAIIVIDRPFNILQNSKDSSFMENALETIDDLFKQCHILEYSWNKDRYIKINAS